MNPPPCALAQVRQMYGLLADESPVIRGAAAALAAKTLRAEADARAGAEVCARACCWVWLGWRVELLEH